MQNGNQEMGFWIKVVVPFLIMIKKGAVVKFFLLVALKLQTPGVLA